MIARVACFSGFVPIEVSSTIIQTLWSPGLLGYVVQIRAYNEEYNESSMRIAVRIGLSGEQNDRIMNAYISWNSNAERQVFCFW